MLTLNLDQFAVDIQHSARKPLGFHGPPKIEEEFEFNYT